MYWIADELDLFLEKIWLTLRYTPCAKFSSMPRRSIIIWMDRPLGRTYVLTDNQPLNRGMLPGSLDSVPRTRVDSTPLANVIAMRPKLTKQKTTTKPNPCAVAPKFFKKFLPFCCFFPSDDRKTFKVCFFGFLRRFPHTFWGYLAEFLGTGFFDIDCWRILYGLTGAAVQFGGRYCLWGGFHLGSLLHIIVWITVQL